MKRIYALLTVLVMAGSTGSAQLIRLVAKQELSFAEIETAVADRDGNDAFNNFFKEGGAGVRPVIYSEEVEIGEGEAMKPLQLNLTDDGSVVDFGLYTVHPNQTVEEQGRNWGNQGNYADLRWWHGQYVKLEAKFPELDKWFNVEYNFGNNTWTGFGGNKPIIYGPAKVRLVYSSEYCILGNNFDTYNGYSNRPLHPDNRSKTSAKPTRKAYYSRSGIGWGMLEVINTFDNAQSANNITVLPNSASDLNLILEASDDLVNWTREGLGKKPAGVRKRFYRLRAVKE
jgi:hypothetical protein